MTAATGLAQGFEAKPALAAEAVASAMQKANITAANAVILLLTEALTPYIKAATRAAAAMAKTTQVIGCSASGIFTEEGWVLDAPAAAAIVLSDGLYLGLQPSHPEESTALQIYSPQSVYQSTINHDAIKRFGGVTGDANGQGHFSVWQNAKGDNTEHASILIEHAQSSITVLHGQTLLSQPQKIDQTLQLDLIAINKQSAYRHLLQAWHQHLLKQPSKTIIDMPTHRLCVRYAKTKKQLVAGDFSQANVISLNEIEDYVTLSEALSPGHYMCWALRGDAISEETILEHIDTQRTQLDTQSPDFGLLFSCLTRGPFKDGIDHELQHIKKALPEMPLIGFYGNGTVAHANHKNQLLSHSLVFNLYKSKPNL